jgi:hypothetical protein
MELPNRFWSPRRLHLAFVVSRVFIFFWFLSGVSSDVDIYRSYAEKVMAGQVPFRDFAAEYPPLAFVLLVLPGVLDPSFAYYHILFRAICCAVDFGIWNVILRTNRHLPSQCLLYLVCTLVLGPLIYDRLDIVLGAMLLFSLWALRKNRWNEFQWAIGFAIAFKLIPMVLVPAILAAQWNRDRRQVGTAILRLLAPLFFSCGLIYLLGGDNVLYVLEYHSQRGMEIHSVPASIAMLLTIWGSPVEVSLGFGSHNLESPHSDMLIRCGTLLLGLISLGGAWFVLSRKPAARSLAVLLAAILVGAVTCSKVLSPQYFLFLIPLVAYLPPPADNTDRISLWILIFGVYSLTGLLYPWYFDKLVELDLGMCGLLVLRNLGLIALGAVLVCRACQINFISSQEIRLTKGGGDAPQCRKVLNWRE